MIKSLAIILKDYQREIFASLILSTTLLLFSPISVYQNNVGSLGFNLTDVGYLWLGLTLGGFAVSAFVAIAVGRYFFEYPAVIYLALILCLWVQGNFLAYDLGALDGRAIDWGVFRNYYIVEAVLWIGAIAAAVWFRKRIYKNLNFLLVMALLPQIGPLVITGFEQYARDRQNTSLYFNQDKEFEFSSDKNVVIIVLDATRSDAVEQVVTGNPAHQAAFKDFTFFRNTTAGYPTTRPSIPLILSGVHNDNSIPVNQYEADTQQNSLPSLLKKSGYTVEYYSFGPFAYLNTWDNASDKPSRTDLIDATREIYLVGLLRYLPLPFKPVVVDRYYAGRDYWGRDIVEFHDNAAGTAKANKAPVFKFIHLRGAHPPFLLSKSLERSQGSSYVEQVEASILAVDRLLQEMKSSGVYDNSLIIVVADHGYAGADSMRDEFRRSSTSLMLSGMPLLMAKGQDKNQPAMGFSESPVSVADIPKTVMEVLGIDNELPGMSLFANIPEDRRRVFYYYDNWNQAGWRQRFLPPLYKIEIEGSLRNPKSWRFLGDVRRDAGQVELSSTHYNYGENIVSSSSNYLRLFSFGFGARQGGAWATGPVSCLHLPVTEEKKDVTLLLSATPFLERARIQKQQMDIFADDELVKSLQLDRSNTGSVTVPLSPDLAGDGEIELCFGFPDAKLSPRDLGMSDDARLLGAFFQSIIIK